MSIRKGDGQAAEPSSPPQTVCTLVVDAIIDEFDVEIRCQRTDGLIEFFRPPWTGCVLRDQAKTR
jgi:hypothetical protein